MDFNLSELDNTNTKNPYENFDYNSYQQNSGNYWESLNKNTDTKPKKKKVSFDDILSNMNLVVNKEGVLQFMTPNQQEQPNNQLSYNQQGHYYNTNVRQVHYTPNQDIHQIPLNGEEPLNPQVKHSYIYNKYFKDYAEPDVKKIGPRVPKTIEEYRQMLLDDRIKAIQHKIRVEQIKSKKLLFVSTDGSQTNPRNIRPTKNNLRSMSFR
jgi:hypothetical protein